MQSVLLTSLFGTVCTMMMWAAVSAALMRERILLHRERSVRRTENS